MGCSELNLGIYDASFRYEEAERLYFAGKIDEAITVLDSEKLPPSAGKNIADAVQSWRLKGQLLTLKYQFEDAQRAYETALRYINCKTNPRLWAETEVDLGITQECERLLNKVKPPAK